jgi:hypothetical protein
MLPRNDYHPKGPPGAAFPHRREGRIVGLRSAQAIHSRLIETRRWAYGFGRSVQGCDGPAR